MLKPVEQSARERVPPFQVLTLGARTVLRLKSWEPRHLAGESLVLAGWRLPRDVGDTLSGPPRMLCTAPAEWLIVSQQSAARVREQIEGSLASGLVLVDLTEGLTGLQVSGWAVREVLPKGCCLNLHAQRFPAGTCARTRFAQIPVVIDCVQDPDEFELYVPRSYAHYLKDWLLDAAVEFEEGTP